jgi:hypothetical protein
MVYSIKEIQLEFDFMKKGPDPIEIVEKQERYDEYIKRMYRETEEKDASL